MVPDLIEPRRRKFEAGREAALAVTHFDEHREFVDSEESPHPVAQPLGDISRVVGERAGGVARLPAAPPILQGLRQIPMIERRERGDSVGEQFVDQAVVEIEALRI